MSITTNIIFKIGTVQNTCQPCNSRKLAAKKAFNWTIGFDTVEDGPSNICLKNPRLAQGKNRKRSRLWISGNVGNAHCQAWTYVHCCSSNCTSTAWVGLQHPHPTGVSRTICRILSKDATILEEDWPIFNFIDTDLYYKLMFIETFCIFFWDLQNHLLSTSSWNFKFSPIW